MGPDGCSFTERDVPTLWPGPWQYNLFDYFSPVQKCVSRAFCELDVGGYTMRTKAVFRLPCYLVPLYLLRQDSSEPQWRATGLYKVRTHIIPSQRKVLLLKVQYSV